MVGNEALARSSVRGVQRLLSSHGVCAWRREATAIVGPVRSHRAGWALRGRVRFGARDIEVLRANLVTEEKRPVELQVGPRRVDPPDADRPVRRIAQSSVVRRRMAPLFERASSVRVAGRQVLALVVGVVSDACESIEGRAAVGIDVREVMPVRHVDRVFVRDTIEQRDVDERRELERLAIGVDAREGFSLRRIEVRVVAVGAGDAGLGGCHEDDETRQREKAKSRVKHTDL